MEQGKPSRTAFSAAAHRAAHQIADRPLVFEDPLAVKVLGEGWAPDAELLGRRPMRAHIVARSRLAEDALAAAYAKGLRQYLVLGAGLDTFAWRNPHAALRVFEADHPDTQAWKRDRWAGAGTPDCLTFAPVDFERQSLTEGLAAAGLDLDAPLFVAWLGVVTYLTPEGFNATLGALAAISGGVELVFDYGQPPATLPPLVRAAYERRAAKLAAIGEPWLSFFEPAKLADRLSALGYAVTEDLGPDEINARYFDGRDDGLRVLAGRIVRART